jgi:hypothetical protein
MDNSKQKYETPKIISLGEIARAIGAESSCWGGKSADICTPGNGGIVSTS